MYNSIYIYLYTRICLEGISDKKHYAPGSGLHKHHIQPKHSGGKDVETNYTYLTVQEHITAHHLLYLIHGLPEDILAMKVLRANLDHYGLSGRTGFKHSDETKAKLRAINLGKKHSDETKAKLRAISLGKKQPPRTAETKAKISAAKMGSKHSDETKAKMSAAHRNKQKTAEHCANISAAKKGKGQYRITNEVDCKSFITLAAKNLFLSQNPSWRSGHRKKTTSSGI